MEHILHYPITVDQIKTAAHDISIATSLYCYYIKLPFHYWFIYNQCLQFKIDIKAKTILYSFLCYICFLILETSKQKTNQKLQNYRSKEV